MALKAALALWNIIDANQHKPTDDTINSNTASNISILNVSNNSNINNVDLHEIYDTISPMEYAILNNLTAFAKKAKEYDPETQLIGVIQLGSDQWQKPQQKFTNESLTSNELRTIKEDSPDVTHLQTEKSQKLYYQGRDILELDIHLRTSWMSFKTAQMNCNNLSVEDFLLNRGQISRIADIWPPQSQLKKCPIRDCQFIEYIYQ